MDKKKLIEELIEAAYQKGYDDALNATLTHGDYPTKKELKDNYNRVRDLLAKVMEIIS